MRVDPLAPLSLPPYFIEPNELLNSLGRATAPQLIDVCRAVAFEKHDCLLPTARWHDPALIDEWIAVLDHDRPIVVNCVHGHNVSQLVAARLRALGYAARVLAGGYAGWVARGFPPMRKSAVVQAVAFRPSKWIATFDLGIDHIAFAWLLTRFVDPDCAILFTTGEQLDAVAEEIGATLLVPETYPHASGFADKLNAFGLSFEPLHQMASDLTDVGARDTALGRCLRGAILTAEANPQAGISNGFHILDALYAWHARAETPARDVKDTAA